MALFLVLYWSHDIFITVDSAMNLHNKLLITVLHVENKKDDMMYGTSAYQVASILRLILFYIKNMKKHKMKKKKTIK